MNVLAIYSVNEHIAQLLAEASAERMVRTERPTHSVRLLLASLLTFRRATPAVAAS